MRASDMRRASAIAPGGPARRAALLHGVALGLVLLPAGPVASAPASGDAAVQLVLRKAQALLRQLSEEKRGWEAERVALLEQQKVLQAAIAQLDPLAKQVPVLQGEIARRQAAADRLRAEKTAAEGELRREQGRSGALQQELRKNQQQLALTQQDNRLLIAAVGEREHWIGDCRARNVKLAAIGRELVGRYEDKGFWEQLADAEPLTGIGKVATENLVQEYRFRIEDLKMPPVPAAPERFGTEPPRAGAAAEVASPADAGVSDDDE